MKAVVFHGIGDIRLDDVPEPKIQESMDAPRASDCQCYLWYRSAHDSRYVSGNETWDNLGS